MAVATRTRRIAREQAQDDKDNPSLPLIVRQMLHSSGSDYELERTRIAELGWRYYDSTQYKKDWLRNTADRAAASQSLKALYTSIKPLYQAVNTACNVDRDRIYVGAKLTPKKTDEKLQNRLTVLWDRAELDLLVKRGTLFGAVTGDHYKCAVPSWMDARDEGQPSRIDVYTPDIMTVLRNQHNQRIIEVAKIEYQYLEAGSAEDLAEMRELAGPAGRVSVNSARWDRPVNPIWDESVHTYTMIITPDAYYTFRDWKLYPYPENPGERDTWDNPLGVVPVVHCPFIDTGKDSGDSAWKVVEDTLDAVNEGLSLMQNVISNNADPILIMYGVNPNAVITKGTTEDGTTVWYIPTPANPFASIGSTGTPPKAEFLQVDASGIGAFKEFFEMITNDIVETIPELRLKKMDALGGESGFDTNLKLQILEGRLMSVREWDFKSTERIVQIALLQQDIKRKNQADGLALIEKAKDKYDLIVRADPVLPKDLTSMSARQATDLANGVTSRREIMYERGKTDEEIDKINKQREEEAMADAELQAKIQGLADEAMTKSMEEQGKVQQQMMETQMNGVVDIMGSLKELMGTNPQAMALGMSAVMQMLQTLGVGKMPTGSTLPGAPKPPLPGQSKGPTPPTKPGGAAGTSPKSVSQPNKARTGERQRRSNPGRKS